MKFTSDEAKRVQKYLQMKFANQKITVGAFSKSGDSAEILLDGEFMGTLYKDTEDGETSYDFNMAILDIDLPPAA
ncbi:MAG: DUF3126 family protein [Micavibrio aeruginosavorus]|uniref:DUF3126 family protein n=1 Tax=Micavibrio aeruginosavorus TaxID=349221 RepID=A0A7T5R0E0_9BACT|nr:MAG: DUF3126 family protein [Micavibrio aeruginosavorus]